MQILVLYSTGEGHTAKIADAFAEVFQDLGHEVFLTATSDPGYCDPGTFDAAVLCAPIHMGGYPTDFIQYVRSWKSALAQVPNVLVTASLFIACADKAQREEARKYPASLTALTGWMPDRIYNVAGSLNYPEYDFFKGWIMKSAAKSENWPTDTSEEHDFTDWEGLRAFADEFVKVVKSETA